VKAPNHFTVDTTRNVAASLREYQNNSEKVRVFTWARHRREEERKTERKKEQTNQAADHLVM